MSEKSKDAVVHLQGVASSAATTTTVELLTRSNLAAQILNAAATAARTANAIEEKDPQLTRAETATDTIQQSTVAIVMASTALEACANEIITDILARKQGISAGLREELEQIRASTKGNVLEKLKSMAKKLGGSGGSIDKGKPPYDDAGALLDLRNALVHFRPAWSDNKDVHESDEAKRIERVVGRSRFYQGEPNFPIGYLHYSSAKWAVRTVRDVSQHFSGVIGEEDRFNCKGFDYTLP